MISEFTCIFYFKGNGKERIKYKDRRKETKNRIKYKKKKPEEVQIITLTNSGFAPWKKSYEQSRQQCLFDVILTCVGKYLTVVLS